MINLYTDQTITLPTLVRIDHQYGALVKNSPKINREIQLKNWNIDSIFMTNK